MARTGIDSLNAGDSDSLEVGAPKLRLTGNKMAGGPYNLGSDRKNAAAVWQNMDEGDKSIYNFNFEFFLQSGDWMDQIQGSLQTGDRQMASAPHPDENWDALWQDLREKGEVPEIIRNLQEFKNWFHNQDFDIDMSQRNRSGIMQAAYGGTARPTYTQSRKQRMAYGGIAGLDGRKRYGIGSWFQENIMDPIKGTADKLIPNELKNPVGAALAGTALNYAPVMMGLGEDTLIQKGLGALGVPEKYTQTNALDFLRSIGTDPNVVSGISGEINPFDPTDPGKSRPIVGYDDKTGNPIYGPSEAEKADQGIISKGLEALKKFVLPSGSGTGTGYDDQGRPIINWQDPLKYGAMIGALDYALRDKTPFPMDQTGIKFQTGAQAMADPELRFKPQAQYANVAEGGRIGAANGGIQGLMPRRGRVMYPGGYAGTTWREFLEDKTVRPNPDDKSWKDVYYRWLDQQKNKAQGGRIGAQEGGLMDLGGMEKDYREEGGFVPIGGQEKADDVPARLSKNEFVFTADAVRAAGGGDIDRGAEIMENLMDNLEAGGKVSEESQGLEGARNMFANAQQLEKRII